MTDDLTRARARRIAKERTTAQIRADILQFQAACPSCGIALNAHDSHALDRCAMELGGDDNSPRSA